MARKLTAKQEAFKNLRIQGVGVSASYKLAYPDQNMNDKAVSVAANKLDKDPRVRLEVNAKRKEAAERAVVTTKELAKMLLSEGRGDKEDSTPASRVAALKTLTDYTGGFDANKVKTEVTGKDGAPIETKVSLDKKALEFIAERL